MKTLLNWLETLYSLCVDRPFRTGTVIAGHYEILLCLGMGSYGISYLCRDRRTGQRCVLKQVKPSKKGSRKGAPIYEYETSLLAALDHPCIPKLLATFRHQGHLFFAMEYMDGKNLEDVLFELGKSFTEREALLVIRELLEIIAYLHERRIIHRDVRIPNVILSQGRLCLIDFGLARYLGDKPTAAADDLGSYPSEKRLKREIAYKSDFYALGHFLLFLLYSTYETEEDTEERNWDEELSLSPLTKRLLQRLLQDETPYEHVAELRVELEAAIEACT